MRNVLSGMLVLGGEARPGWLAIEGGRISGAAHGPCPDRAAEAIDGLLAPGLLDLQVNGAAGREILGDEEDLDMIEAALSARGVTSFLATVVTTDDDAAAAAVERLARRAADADSPIVGIHLEGPFLSPAHAGIHRTDLLRAPAEGVPAFYGDPAVRLVTLAPELPGALDLISRLRRRGVRVALGHSGADAATATRAVAAGASLVTHVFNAMGPLHHREPGLAGVALVDRRVHVGVIADGLHLDPLVLEIVRRAAGDRVVLVSDSSPAAAAEPGRYQLAGAAVELDEEGAVRDEAGRLAGSALTLAEAVPGWVRRTQATPAEAVAAAGESPALALGLAARLGPGTPADLVVLDAAARVTRVMRRGSWTR